MGRFGEQYARVIPRFASNSAHQRWSPVAQLAELPTVNRKVSGSSPLGGATSKLAAMRAYSVVAAVSLALASAGCGWSPPSGNTTAEADSCTPTDGPNPQAVDAEVDKLPPPAAGEQWRETARGHTTDCRLYWVQVGATNNAPDSPQQVLFFDHDVAIGTPTPQPQPYVAVVTSGEDTVTVQYQWNKGTDEPCCPTGIGTVRFRAGDGSTLVPLDPIPNS